MGISFGQRLGSWRRHPLQVLGGAAGLHGFPTDLAGGWGGCFLPCVLGTGTRLCSAVPSALLLATHTQPV